MRIEEAHSRNVNDILLFEVESSCVIPLSDSTIVHRIAFPECVSNKPKCWIDKLRVLVAAVFQARCISCLNINHNCRFRLVPAANLIRSTDLSQHCRDHEQRIMLASRHSAHVLSLHTFQQTTAIEDHALSTNPFP